MVYSFSAHTITVQIRDRTTVVANTFRRRPKRTCTPRFLDTKRSRNVFQTRRWPAIVVRGFDQVSRFSTSLNDQSIYTRVSEFPSVVYCRTNVRSRHRRSGHQAHILSSQDVSHNGRSSGQPAGLAVSESTRPFTRY